MNSLQGTPVNTCKSRRLQWDAKFLGSSLECLCMWILFTGYWRKMDFFYMLQDFVKMVSPLICISHSLKVKNKFLLANYTRHNFCVLHAILDNHVISVNRIFYDVKEKIHDNLNHCENSWPYHCTTCLHRVKWSAIYWPVVVKNKKIYIVYFLYCGFIKYEKKKHRLKYENVKSQLGNHHLGIYYKFVHITN